LKPMISRANPVMRESSVIADTENAAFRRFMSEVGREKGTNARFWANCRKQQAFSRGKCLWRFGYRAKPP
jgi:hypothetical protein